MTADRLILGAALAAALFGVALFCASAPFAAEPSARPHEITLIFAKPTDSNRSHMTLGTPYESREACMNAIVRVKVQMTGARLQCNPTTETYR